MLSLDLASLRRAYTSGGLTPTALVEDIFNRIAAHADPAIWIHLLPREAVLEQARQLKGKSPAELPLYGVPFAIKDNIDLAGVPTTAACREFSYVPKVSAPVVQRLIDAGAIPLGKANLDQFATGLVGVRSPFGVPRNPFRADVIPGGSSSGSAVSVAAGLASFALGTDTAGSGRVPAGLNNLVGLKPTRGALSTSGVVPACRTLDCVSIFALTCSDAAEVLAVVEAFDPADPYSRPSSSSPTNTNARLRVGVPPANQLEFGGDALAATLFRDSLVKIRELGAELVEIDFTPFRETAALLYQGPWIAERWAALRTFHAKHAAAFLPVTRKIVEGAAALSAADTFDGLYRLAALTRRTEAEWDKMDVLLVPTAPRPLTLDELEAKPIELNTLLGTYTNFVNLLDLSALAVPAGIRGDGIPWGVTFIAPAWQEMMLLELGAKWHATLGGRLGATDTVLPSIAPRGVTPKISSEDANVRVAVVGAHLSGLPLNPHLLDLSARLVWTGTTAPSYQLYALAGTVPPKPGLKRVRKGGAAIAVEVWELGAAEFGRFVAAIPPPLCIGTVELATDEQVKGFLCEPAALEDAADITAFGGWKNYLARKQ